MKRFLQRKNTWMNHVWLRSFMVCLCLALAGVSTWGQTPEGKGTKEEPYQLDSKEDLEWFRDRVNAGYPEACAILTKDIILNNNCDSYEQWGVNPPLYSWIPIKFYSGIFDGDSHSIKGIYIKETDEEAYGHYGLFSEIKDGEIKNLGVENTYIDVIFDNVGGIAAKATNSIISNCHFEGLIKAENGGRFAGICAHDGGIIPSNTIKNCYSGGNIQIELDSKTPNTVSNPNEGAIGVFINGIGMAKEIMSCYNKGKIDVIVNDVKIENFVPICIGVSGIGFANIINSSYNIGEIKTSGDGNTAIIGVGGINGLASVDVSIVNSYNYGLINSNVISVPPTAEFEKVVGVGNFLGTLFLADVKQFDKNYYLKNGIQSVGIDLINPDLDYSNFAFEKEKDEFKVGEIAWLLRQLNEEDRSYVFGQNLNGSTPDEYPKLQCFDSNLPAVYQLKYTTSDNKEVIQYYNPGQTTEALPELGNDLRWFGEDGTIYESGFSMPAKDLVLTEETGYSIKIENVEHGTISIVPDQTLYKVGTPITVTVKAYEGYQFKSLECKTADTDVSVTNNNDGTYSFTMPDADVTISATFDPIQYQVTIADDIQHGNVVATPTTATAGTSINLTITSETGYQIKELYYKVEDSEDAVSISDKSFKMPEANVTIYATFEAIKYQVSISDDIENGTVAASPTEATVGETITLTVTPNNGYQLDKLYYVATGTTTKVSITGTTFAMPESDVTVYATFTEKEDPTDPEEPVDPPVVDPTNYYNIYNETTYDFIDVSFSRNVVREGGSVNVYLGIPEGLDPAAVTLMFKRSLYGGWENLNTDDDGNYLINNIWTDIYVKAVVDESYIDPNPDENHIYIDLSETNDSIWLYTDHKLVEEGKTAVIQAEVAKSCQNKEIRYMYKRTVLGEWKEMPKDYSINQYVVRDITTDIYVKAYFVFDKQDPTTAKNPHHVYADITATCEGLYLDATRHKVADEGDTKVFLYVKKGFETKDARYLFKRGLKGEWEDLVPGIEQNTFQVTDIEGDIYLKGIDAVYTGTEDIDGMVRVYTKDGSLFVYTAQPEEISVVSMTGVTVKRTRQTGLQSYPLNQGIYVVCIGEQVFKVRVK